MQASLFPGYPTFHGGALVAGRRKSLRPLARNRPVHFVLKAHRPVLFAQRGLVESELRRLAGKFHVRIYHLAVNHDHLHFLARLPGREAYRAFIRAFSGLLARKLGKGLWKLLPFSRVLAWGRDFQRTKAYLEKNREEASGERPYEPRKNWYRQPLRHRRP